MKNDTMNIKRFFCLITSEECGHHGSKTIKTTVEQDEKAIQKINAIKNKKPKYNILFNNTGWLIDGPNRDILYSRRASQRNIL